jgi:hypothetical protein
VIHPLPVDKPRLQEFICSLGLDPGVARLAKDQYYLPDRDWLSDVFAPALARQQDWDGAAKYRKWKWICADFARHAANFAARCFASNSDMPDDGGFAFGVFNFALPPSAHAINVAICGNGDGGLLELVTFEPQPPPRIIRLTREEIQSCFDISF